MVTQYLLDQQPALWQVLTSTCGTTSLGSASQPRQVAVVQAAAFVDRAYTFAIPDDYDVTKDVNGQPLRVRLHNYDSIARVVTVNVANPYNDLILGFTGLGSVNHAVTLAAGQTFDLNLRVFTQNILQAKYALTLNLTADGVTDSIPLSLVIQRPAPNVVFDLVGTPDPVTMITTGRLTNNGTASVTDLDFDIVQTTSGIPANFIVEPDIHHVYLSVGQSIEVKIIPLELIDSNQVHNPTADNLSVSLSLMPSLKHPRNSMLSLPGPFSGKVCVGGNCTTTARYVSNECPSGSHPFTISVDGVRVVEGKSAGWYCTNNPNIDVPMGLNIPSDADVIFADLSVHFYPDADAYQHQTNISVNSIGIGGATVPGTSSTGQGYTWSVPSGALKSQDLQGDTNRTIVNVRSVHPYGNKAHYVVATNFTMRDTATILPSAECHADASTPNLPDYLN